ncbi:MAG TPA: class IV adenylate cyclase [Pirellulales bacterium]|nr:class IV adenylate cyclase [Pirellulales bacterium]
MHYEVEQKFVLANPADMQARLSALGAQAAGACDQVDCYFSHPARDFAQTDEALRIRRVNGQTRITYKGPKIDRETKTRQEIELPLPAGATTADDFGRLLVALGFAPVAEVRKHRRTFDLTWQGYSVEAALDEVAGLGHFVELEISANEESVDAARAALVSLAARLELAASERRSYLELLLERRAGIRPPSV